MGTAVRRRFSRRRYSVGSSVVAQVDDDRSRHLLPARHRQPDRDVFRPTRSYVCVMAIYTRIGHLLILLRAEPTGLVSFDPCSLLRMSRRFRASDRV